MSPDLFEETLRRNYDPRLSLRWGAVIGSWIIEREAPIPPELMATLLRGMKKAVLLLGNPAVPEERKDQLKKACEEGLSAEHGKRVIIYCSQLDNRVFNALWAGDLQRHGLDIIDKTKNRREGQRERDRHEVFSETSREVDSVIHWALQKKATEVAHGKADDIIRDAFGKEARKQQPYSLPPLVDATGVPLAPKKNAKIHLASR